jgi:hypothetical protein
MKREAGGVILPDSRLPIRALRPFPWPYACADKVRSRVVPSEDGGARDHPSALGCEAAGPPPTRRAGVAAA